MASSGVRSLIDQNIEAQMASDEVRSRIEQEIEKQRQSSEYLDSVAEALEENGENGEAYRALSELREKLDDVQKFYDGLQDYTDGVNELLDGTQEMKDGTGEFRDETADINDTINEKIDNMIAEKTGSNVRAFLLCRPPQHERGKRAVRYHHACNPRKQYAGGGSGGDGGGRHSAKDTRSVQMRQRRNCRRVSIEPAVHADGHDWSFERASPLSRSPAFSIK